MDADHLDGLVDAARAGGHWAFERLWVELSPRVAGYLRGRGVTDADDVTSETFLAAFQGMASFTGDGAAFRSWLFTIAHHRGVDWHRRSSRAPAESPYEQHRDRRTVASAESGALVSLQDVEVRRLLAQLSPEQADVMLLRVLGQLTIAEIATATGRSEGAVKQLQRRAVARLRLLLAETSAEPVPLSLSPTIASSR